MTRLASERHNFLSSVKTCHSVSYCKQPGFFCPDGRALIFASLSLRGLLAFCGFSLADCWEQTWRCEDTLLSVRRDCYGCFAVRLADTLEDKSVKRAEAPPDVPVAPGCDRRDEEPPARL